MKPAHPISITALSALLSISLPGQSDQSQPASFYRGLLAELVDHDFIRARREYERSATEPTSTSREVSLARLIELDRIQARSRDSKNHTEALRKLTNLEPSRERRNRYAARRKLQAVLAGKSPTRSRELIALRKELAKSSAAVRPVTYRVIRHLDDKASAAQRPSPGDKQIYRSRMRSMRRMAAVVANRHLDGKRKSANELARVLRRGNGRWLGAAKPQAWPQPEKSLHKALSAIEKYLGDRSMPVYERQVVTRIQTRIKSMAAAKKHTEALKLLQRLPYYDRKFLRS